MMPFISLLPFIVSIALTFSPRGETSESEAVTHSVPHNGNHAETSDTNVTKNDSDESLESSISTMPNFLVLYVDHASHLMVYLKKLSKGVTQDNFAAELPHITTLLHRSAFFENSYGEMTTTSSAATLLTGKSAVDTGMIQGKILSHIDFPSLASSGGLPATEQTISRMLGEHGYYSGYVGRWTLGIGGGMHLPVSHGFDAWTGFVAPSTMDCKKIRTVSQNKKEGLFQHPYINFIKKTFPIWVGVVVFLLTLYCFEWLHFRGVANALIYTICGSLILYLLLKTFQVQKLAACILYKNKDIIEQPYDASNVTLFTTLKALKFLLFSSQTQLPFYLHVSYSLSETDDTPSISFNGQSHTSLQKSLLKLDWSIGKIMEALQDNYQFDNTIVILTGGSDCIRNNHNTKHGKYQNASVPHTNGFARDGFENFKIYLYDFKDSLQSCLQVPLLFSMPDWDPWTFDLQSNVAVSDIYPTIKYIMAKYNGNTTSIKNYSSCSLIKEKPHISTSTPIEERSDGVGKVLEATALNASCNLDKKHSDDTTGSEEPRKTCIAHSGVVYHYADIIRPVAITLPGPIRVVFANVSNDGRITPLPQPVVFPLTSGYNPLQWTNKLLESIVQNATRLVEQHLSEERPNRWSSQFEMPVYPWYFPCANFPRCEKRRAADDFSFLD